EVRGESSSNSTSKDNRSRGLTPRVYRDWSGGGDRTGCGILSTARFRDWQGCVCSQCLFENRAGWEDHGHGGPVRNRSGRAHSAANDSCGGVGSRWEQIEIEPAGASTLLGRQSKGGSARIKHTGEPNGK